MTRSITIKDRINEIVAMHGSLRKAALALETDVGYLSRLRSGVKTPGPRMLNKLGLEQITIYRHLPARKRKEEQ